jgi:exportin-7
MRNLLFLLVTALASLQCHCVLSAFCHGKPDPRAKPNLNPVQSDPPKFLKSVKNGKLYSAGNGDDLIHIVHVWGSPYEMGYAHGELMTSQAHSFMNDVWSYLEEQVVS